MSIDDLEVLYALRSHLLGTPAIRTTGLITMAATATGFTRPAGSFITDNFRVGMEVTPAGFTDNTPAVIQSLTATEIKIRGSRPVEGSGANRSLTVGIPAMRSWENIAFNPIDDRWYIDEDYLPGVQWGTRIGLNAPTEHNPMYVLHLFGLAGLGAEAPYIVATAILDRFKPRTVIPLAAAHALVVNSRPGPERGQLLPAQDTDKVELVITIPLLKRSPN